MPSDAELRDLVPMNTHEELSRALEAYPHTLERALQGDGDFYWGLIYTTHVGLLFAPWRLLFDDISNTIKETL
jgi:hypothetical protein